MKKPKLVEDKEAKRKLFATGRELERLLCTPNVRFDETEKNHIRRVMDILISHHRAGVYDVSL